MLVSDQCIRSPLRIIRVRAFPIGGRGARGKGRVMLCDLPPTIAPGKFGQTNGVNSKSKSPESNLLNIFCLGMNILTTRRYST